MKAIILAAGIGSRLRPLTNQKPKTLIKVGGKPMLKYLLNSLIANDIKEIILCTGFKHRKIVDYCLKNYPSIDFSFVKKEKDGSTNNMYSLYLARKFLNEDVFIMNSDLIINTRIIEYLKKKEQSVVAVEKGKYNSEAMKVRVKKGIIREISKEILPQKAYGCSLDIYKIIKKDAINLSKKITKIIEIENQKNLWTEIALNRLFKSKKIKAVPCDISPEKWYEIDTHEDLKKARKIFGN